jgi:PKD repeat protein
MHRERKSKMKRLSAAMVIMVMCITVAVLIPTVSAEENVMPVPIVTYSFAPVSGGGCQIESVYDSKEKAHFNFEVQYRDGEPTGSFHLIDHGNTTIPKLRVHSDSISTLTISGNNATFNGTATVNGTRGYSFTAYVEDNGEPGKNNDKFAITITGPGGFAYSPYGELKAGNIQVSGSAEPPTTNQPIEFDASKSYDPDGGIVAYRWDFDGDGTWDIEGNVVMITHSYNKSGSYTVILEVEDNEGATNQTTLTIQINGGGGGEISGDVMWNGDHTFDLEQMTPIGSFHWITITASGITNTKTANVTVELRIDGVSLNETIETLPPGEHTIPITAAWVPSSSGRHFVSLHLRHEINWDYWVGPTNDPTAGVIVFIEKVA